MNFQTIAMREEKQHDIISSEVVQSIWEKLPQKDKVIVEQTLEGKSPKQIAPMVEYSDQKVRCRLDKIRFKFDCLSTAHLIGFLFRNGILK